MANENTCKEGFSNIRHDVWVCLFLVAVTLAVYWQIRNHSFISFDDPVYVTENPRIQKGLDLQGIKWSFTATHGSNWHPLTWLSHMLDCQLFGLKPGMHHLVNLLFHTANTLLLFFVFRRMTGDIWRSGFVAAMFALHPLHVESVTWVSERKDVLSTFFWLLTMWFYGGYVKRPGVNTYLPVLVSFAMGLLAKPMLVTLPFVLLLIDYWPLGRFILYRSSDGVNSETKKSRLFHLILEKVPFFILAGFSSAATLFAQQKGGVLNASPLMIRIANSLVSYISYIGKMIWPYHLAIFYPYPENIPVWHVAGAGLLVMSLSIVVVLTGRRLPFLPVGWLWYLGTLVPVIGLVQVGTQAMADRYTYVPLIGLFILAGWGIPNIMATWPYKRIILPISVGLLLIVFIMTSRLQVSYWKNSTTVFRHALDVTDKNYLAHNSLGNALKRKGSLKEAAVHYSEAIQIKADYAKARNNLGAILMRQGDLKEAIRQYSTALGITPRNAVMLCNLGVALTRYGNIKEAVIHLREALRIRPDFLEARNYLKKALERQSRLKEDNSHFNGGPSVKPNFDAETHKNLGIVLGHQGNIEESIVHFRKALILKPDYAAAYNYMGVALFRQDNIEEAIDSLQEALRIEPNYTEAQFNFKKALATKSKLDHAVDKVQEALQLNPRDAALHCNLANLYKRKGALDEAIDQYQTALSIQPGFTRALNSLAIAHMRKREYEKALSVFMKMIGLRPDRSGAYYNIACIYARQNKLEESIEWLKKAIKRGYNNWDHIKTHKDLDSIRGSLYYEELMKGR